MPDTESTTLQAASIAEFAKKVGQGVALAQRAMDEAALYFVNMPDLQKKAGEKLAEMIGVERYTISKWERGHRRPDPQVISRLYLALGLDAEEIASLYLREEGER